MHNTHLDVLEELKSGYRDVEDAGWVSDANDGVIVNHPLLILLFCVVRMHGYVSGWVENYISSTIVQ